MTEVPLYSRHAQVLGLAIYNSVRKHKTPWEPRVPPGPRVLLDPPTPLLLTGSGARDLQLGDPGRALSDGGLPKTHGHCAHPRRLKGHFQSP